MVKGFNAVRGQSMAICPSASAVFPSTQMLADVMLPSQLKEKRGGVSVTKHSAMPSAVKDRIFKFFICGTPERKTTVSAFCFQVQWFHRAAVHPRFPGDGLRPIYLFINSSDASAAASIISPRHFSASAWSSAGISV